MQKRMDSKTFDHKTEKPAAFSYRTTGQFEKLRSHGTYKRHCSPTAISNIILTLRPELDPDTVFRKVAEIGTSHLIYWNMDLLKRFGGTSDFFTGAYLRMALHSFGINDRKVFFGGMVKKKKLHEAFKRGSMVLLAMHNHPKYKSHHVVCYDMMAKDNAVCLLLADGWSPAPTIMPYDDLKFTVFFEVAPTRLA